MLTESTLDKLKQGLRGRAGSVQAAFRPGEGDEKLGNDLRALGRRLFDALPELLTHVEESDLTGQDVPEPAARPALTFSFSNGGTVHYAALPDGPEEAPFVEMLLGAGDRRASLARDSEAHSGDETELIVFIAPTCPHCPQAVRAALETVAAVPGASVNVVDVTRFAGLAKHYAVRSVPLTMLDRGRSWTGVVPAGTLLSGIAARGSAAHGFSTFVSLVENGRFTEAAQQVVSGDAGPYFLKAWRGSTIQRRIALLLTVEEALEQKEDSMDGTVPGLLDLLESDDAALRGDTADLLGRIGHRAAAEGLTRLLEDPNPDVAEIAGEALEEIRERG